MIENKAIWVNYIEEYLSPLLKPYSAELVLLFDIIIQKLVNYTTSESHKVSVLSIDW